MAINAILFDLDGTLIDTNEAHIRAWREAFLAKGHKVADDAIRPEIGKGGDHLVTDLLGADEERRIGSSLSAAHDDNFRRLARRSRLKVFIGAVPLLEELKRHGIKTAIVTSSKKSMVNATFMSGGIDLGLRVDALITADDAERSKPSPDLLLATLERLDLSAEACVFVGDTTHDGVAAARAEVPFVAVTCGGCASPEELTLAGALSIWTGPNDLRENLKTILAIEANPQGKKF